MKKGILKKAVLLGLALFISTGLVGCKSKTDSQKDEAGTTTQKVVVGLDNTFVPMGFLDENNKIVGFDVDLATEVFKRLGITPEFQNIDWSMKEQSLENKNVDVLWNGYTITEERKKKVNFTDPYFDNKQIAVTMTTESFNDIKELKGQVVGTQAGSSSVDAIDANPEFKKALKNGEPMTYDTFDKALRDLEIGRTKAVIGDEVLLKYYIKQRGAEKYKVLEGDLGDEQYGVGFRKSDTELRNKVNNTLNEMKKDGTFDQIKKKWFE